MKKIFLAMILFSCGPVMLIIAVPAAGVDQVEKLYMCQTEHDLDEINAWEYAAPEKYREATKNSTLMPMDAALASAGDLVAADKIRCDKDNQVVIEKLKDDGDPNSAYPYALKGAELEKYCPITLKKHGHPCL
jgi:hypothetical protein